MKIIHSSYKKLSMYYMTYKSLVTFLPYPNITKCYEYTYMIHFLLKKKINKNIFCYLKISEEK